MSGGKSPRLTGPPVCETRVGVSKPGLVILEQVQIIPELRFKFIPECEWLILNV